MLGILVYATILAILAVLALKRPSLAIVGLFCMFGLEQLGQIYIPFLRTHGTFTNLYILVLLLVAAALTIRSHPIKTIPTLRQYKLAFLCSALYLYALLSFLWAPVNSWDYWAASWPYLIAHIILAPMIIQRPSDLAHVQHTFTWLGGAVALFMATVPDWGARSVVIEGTSEDLGLPLSLAQMCGYLLIIATIHLQKNFMSLAWLTVVVVASLIVAIRTGSRGQLIFSILSLLLVLPIVWKRISIKHVLQLLATAALVSLVSYYIFQLTGTLTSRWGASSLFEDLLNRLGFANILLSEWIGSPLAVIFGLGNSASFAVVGNYTHIVPLEILGEEGIIGFCLLLAIVFAAIRQGQRFNSMTFLSKDIKRAYAANYGCFLFTLLLALKQGSLINSSEIFLFVVLGERFFRLLLLQLAREVEKPRRYSVEPKPTFQSIHSRHI